ncbi:BRO-N domain-containing protein [Klebsiella variicola]|uniref:1-deoxy-D-xylulose-5-phosphate synthase n=1 Tax=Klebsiella variicola TaxID=244366 RepID=A0ABD7P916_KLEVA|nr:BRO family protein [Klebsiella variicola]MCB3051654.1 antirepressor protein [Klebsiella pneumoniae]HCI4635017.1 antirepressor protein [Klebsiella quasipneumoniae subsp. quasipneumoniae]MBC4751642.1 antirepressor protein [Klebsiella variicola]SXF94102.1 1-deoxy-D-xylulose-5-phosphate synthase [Klebsiella variicola]HBT1577764.1 antirepressor protein [Klebsiella pneumoniae]
MTIKNAHAGQGFAHPKNSSDDISVIKFEDTKVRIVKILGEPWFVAADVCAALEITDHKVALRRLDGDEKGECLIPTLGGKQTMRIICESGFYKLIARSRKATIPGSFAHSFSNWVFREVVPSIRKTGTYGVPFAFLNDHTRRKELYMKKASRRGRDLQSCKGEKARLAAEEIELWRKYQPDLLEVH